MSTEYSKEKTWIVGSYKAFTFDEQVHTNMTHVL